MITIKHIDIFKKYGCDSDGFARCATPEEKIFMDYNSWSLIYNLVQDLYLIEKGIASVSFIESTNQKLIENCENIETTQNLKEIMQSK